MRASSIIGNKSLFITIEEALEAYQENKKDNLKRLIEKHKNKPDKKLYNKLIKQTI